LRGKAKPGIFSKVCRQRESFSMIEVTGRPDEGWFATPHRRHFPQTLRAMLGKAAARLNVTSADATTALTH